MKTTLPRASSGVSVFVMVRNEEQCLPDCLRALAWTDDILVLDSFSTDRTCEIAASHTHVRLVQRHFTHYGDQRSYGLNVLRYPHPWVLVIDADEIVSASLAAEVLRVVKEPDAANRDVYYLRRIPWFEGRPMRHNLTASFWIPRLVRPGSVRVEGRVHERITGDGFSGYLQNRLDHHQFAKGLDHWRMRRARYAVMAHEAQAAGETGMIPVTDLFTSHRLRRRAALKQLFEALPFRPLIYLIVNVVLYSAWRDGWAGLRLVLLEADSQRKTVRRVR